MRTRRLRKEEEAKQFLLFEYHSGDFVDVIYDEDVSYRGRIISVDNEGYLVRFTDGTVSRGITNEFMRPADDSGAFYVGDSVEALYANGEVWYSGKIKDIRGNVCDIDYDDGDAECDISIELVRHYFGFYVNQPIDAQWNDNEWYPGIVSSVNDDFTYAVQFDDGDADSAVAEQHIRTRQS